MEVTGIATLVRGEGPTLVIPWCNYPWPDTRIVSCLAERFKVALVSPRGFQHSARLDAASYGAGQVCDDILAAADALDTETFALLGYSFTAAVGALLASRSDRVMCAILGGFPFLADYSMIFEAAQRDAQLLEVGDEFTPEAIVSVYRDLAELAAGDLVTGCPCDLLGFRGANDTVIERLGWRRDHDDALAALGVATLRLDDADHVTAPIALSAHCDELAAWLLDRCE